MKPNQRHDDDADLQASWVAATRAALDQDVRDLDAATLSRLNRARQAALAAAPRHAASAWLRAPRWVPAGFLASAAALALVFAVVVRTPGPAPLPAGDPTISQDFELLSSQDSLDLYEDQEFYSWLDAQQTQSSG
jgi:hypothetical protein